MPRLPIGLLLSLIIGIYPLAACADPENIFSVFVQAPEDIISLSHGHQVGIAPFPEGIPSLVATPIADTLMLTSRVRDGNGEIIGIASELEHFPDLPMQPDSVWYTHWTVVIPGRGSLYAYQAESLGVEVFAAFQTSEQAGLEWKGELKKRSTVGPLPGHRGSIIGGTGEFAGAKGAFIEVGTLRRLTVKKELHAEIELRFYLDKR